LFLTVDILRFTADFKVTGAKWCLDVDACLTGTE